MPSYIPDDDTKYIYLYHANFATARRVLRYDSVPGPDGRQVKSREREDLERAGWSEHRFAQMMYHPSHDPKIAGSPEQVKQLTKQGWSTTPLKHPHENDQHRQVHLEEVTAVK